MHTLTFPSLEEIKKQRLYRQCIEQLELGDIEKSINKLSVDELFLLALEMGNYIKENNGEINSYIVLGSEVAKRLIPEISADTLIQIFENSNYADALKIYLINCIVWYWAVEQKPLPNEYSALFYSVAKNSINGRTLRDYAAWHIADHKMATEVLEEEYDAAPDKGNSMIFLKELYQHNKEAAVKRAQEYLDENDIFTKADINKSALNFTNRLVIRGLDSYNGVAADKILNYNQKILESVEDSYLKQGAIFALSEFCSEKAVSIVSKFARRGQSGLEFFTEFQKEAIQKFFIEASVEEATKFAEIIPTNTVINQLEKKLYANDSAKINENHKMLLRLKNSNKEETVRASTSTPGYPCYRTGVVFFGSDMWHAGIVNVAKSMSTFKTWSTAIIHTPGYKFPNIIDPNAIVQTCSYTTFVGKSGATTNEFKGIYKYNRPYDDPDDLRRIHQMAGYLADEQIKYDIISQFMPLASIREDPTKDNDYEVKPNEISTIRCDGVVEYSYEFWLNPLLGGANTWNVAHKIGYMYHGGNTSISPIEQQRQCFTFDMK